MIDTVETFLKSKHTKQLLNYLHDFQVYESSKYEDGDDEISYTWSCEIVNGYMIHGDLYISKKQLKDELALREHIPNKTEAKLIRQQKAKEKKNR